MQTAYQNQNMFRISFNKRKISHDKHSKGVSLAIQQPVLDQYNHIDLQKNTHNKRISHLMTQQACKSIKDDIGKGGESLDLNKWEKTLDRYMQAKQRIHQRNSTERNQFHFFKLSRINQYRKKKLAEENLVPMSLFKQAQINQVQQLKTIAESYNGIRQSIRLKNQLNSSAHVSKHNNDFSNQVYKRHSIDLSQNSHSSPETQQERILAKFVASYLKKKYKKIDKQKDEKDKSLNKFNFKNLLIMKTLNGHKNNN